MDFNTIELSRFNKSWGSVGYINQGKYYSSDGIRHWVSYAKFGNFNIDYNQQTISSATISFTASGGRYSDPTEIGVYFGLSKEDAKKLQQGTDLFTNQKYVATIEAHGKSGATRTITLNATGLNQFMTYFNSTNPTLVFFSETDRGTKLTTAGTYSYNYVQLSNLILTIETTPKAASFSNLPSQIVIGQSSELQATALSGSYTYKAIWNLGNQKTNPIKGTQSGTVVSFKTNIPAGWGSEFPTATSASGSITIETYSGSNKIGSNTNTITYSVPNYNVSTNGIILSNPSGSTYYNSSGTIVYLHNLSKIGISITPTTSYGSGLQKVEIIYNGKTTSSNFPTSGNFTYNLTLNQSGKNTLEIKIYDRRGKSNSITRTYTVYSDLPSLTNLVVERSSNTGENKFDGKNLKIIGTLANASGITLKYGTTLGSYSSTTGLTSATGYWFTTSSVFNTDKIYYLQITITSSKYYTKDDKKTKLTQTYLSQLESSRYLMHFNTAGNGVGIGGAAEAGKIKLHWPTTLLKEMSVDGQVTFNNTVSFNSTNKSLPITQGGTGAISADTACENLGALRIIKWANGYTAFTDASELVLGYKVGDTDVNVMRLNTNYTSFSKPVTIGAGGTGASTAKQALTNLGIIYSTSQPAYAEGKIWLKPV